MPRRNPCRLYIHVAFTYSIGPSNIVWSELGDWLRLFHQWEWSRALNLVCEVALIIIVPIVQDFRIFFLLFAASTLYTHDQVGNTIGGFTNLIDFGNGRWTSMGVNTIVVVQVASSLQQSRTTYSFLIMTPSRMYRCHNFDRVWIDFGNFFSWVLKTRLCILRFLRVSSMQAA